MLKQSARKNQEGFSTLEILIALLVMSFCIAAIIMMVYGGQSLTIDSQTYNEAAHKAQTMLESARASSTQDFNSVNPVVMAADTDPTYKKSLDVIMLDSYTKKISSNVTWNEEGGRKATVTLTTLLTNPGGLSNSNVCNSVSANPNGWKNPQHYDFATPDMLPPPHANGIAISYLMAFNKRLYITASSTPNPSPETFFIFDLPDDPSQIPILRGRIDNATSTNIGLNAVAVASSTLGSYAYVANGNKSNFNTCNNPNGTNPSCGQMQVIDVTDPALPGNPVKYTFKISGVTGMAGQSIGQSIFYKNGIVYLGLAKTPDATANDTEFNLIDVGGGGHGGSPTHPVYLGGYQVKNTVNSIFVNNNYAYIASPNNENLTVIDVSDPTNPHRVGGYAPAGGSHGESVYSIGNTAYLGRTFGNTEFYILNVASSTNISVIGSQDVGTGNKTSVNGLAIKDYLAFLITKAQFQVWDISTASTTPGTIKPWTSDGTPNTFLDLNVVGGSGTSLNCSGDYFYLAIASSQGNNKDILSIITPGP